MKAAKDSSLFPLQVYQSCFKVPPVFADELESAGLCLVYLESLDDLEPSAPAIVVYGEPSSLIDTKWACDLFNGAIRPSPYVDLLSLCRGQSPGFSRRVLFVNINLDLPAAVVAWYFNQSSECFGALRLSRSCDEQSLEVVDFLLTLELISLAPEVVSEYIGLEANSPADLGFRQPDEVCISRYRQATHFSMLLQLRQDMVLLRSELQDLNGRHAALQSDREVVLSLLERLRDLQSVSMEAQASQAALSDLRLAYVSSAGDMDELSRRCSLLARLVADAAAASLSLQAILASLLAR